MTRKTAVKVSFLSIFFRERSVTECSFFGFELDSLQIEVVHHLDEVDVSGLDNQYDAECRRSYIHA